jgi:hypothetical protein
MNYPNDVKVAGNYAYVTDAEGLKCINIAEPCEAVLTDSVQYSSALFVDVAGKYAYVTADNKLNIVYSGEK